MAIKQGIQIEFIMTENSEIFSKELGQRIAQFRKEQRLTQQELADALRLRQYAVANYEIGRYRVPVTLLPELARVLNVSLDELLGMPPSRSKPGPAPKVQRQLEKIQSLPKEKQKSILQVLDMALRSA